MANNKSARRRIALAVALSLAGHVAIIAVLALELDQTPDILAPPPVVEISFVPFETPPKPQQLEEKPRQDPPASPAPVQRSAASPLPSATPSPIAAARGPETMAGPAGTPSQFSTGCVGKRGAKDEQIDCKLEVWNFFDGRPDRNIPGNDIPTDKRAAYAAAAQRQAHQRTKPAQLGNGSSMGCVQANLGAGCTSDMLIKLFGSGPRKDGQPPTK